MSDLWKEKTCGSCKYKIDLGDETFECRKFPIFIDLTLWNNTPYEHKACSYWEDIINED